MRFLKYIFLFLFLPLFFSSCLDSHRYANSFILGNWLWQDSTVDASVWAATDAFSYRFLENGVYIKHGGSEPLEPTKYCYELVGDTVLHLYISSDIFYDESYKITSVSKDTIWLKANPSDQDGNWSIKMGDSEAVSYLVRY